MEKSERKLLGEEVQYVCGRAGGGGVVKGEEGEWSGAACVWRGW